MGKVSWSATARKCLQEIGDYIAVDSPFYAVDFVERILAQTDKLAQFPQLGRVVPEFQHNDMRELLFHNYRIVYRVRRKDVVIVAVAHASIDIVSRSRAYLGLADVKEFGLSWDDCYHFLNILHYQVEIRVSTRIIRES